MERTQKPKIIKDLESKLVFLTGPRQVGKTWLSRDIGSQFSRMTYLNYDQIQDRKIIENQTWAFDTQLLILDEIHKMEGWKNFIKGVFDTRASSLRIMITGSARLDVFRQQGDSMAGRFFAHRLLPLSLAELKGTPYEGDLDRLIDRGGFPEPFLAEDPIDAKRWRLQYIDGLFQDDPTSIDTIYNIKLLRILVELLRYRVGSPISMVSLARDMNISPATVVKYLSMLEAMFIVFRITPWAHNIARSILKEPKLYFFDTGLVDDTNKGAQLENAIAVSLLKHCFAKADYDGEPHILHYLRDKEGHEADFCIVNGLRILQAIEIKKSDDGVAKGLLYFCTKYSLEGIQVVHQLRNERSEGAIQIRKAVPFLESLRV